MNNEKLYPYSAIAVGWMALYNTFVLMNQLKVYL